MGLNGENNLPRTSEAPENIIVWQDGEMTTYPATKDGVVQATNDLTAHYRIFFPPGGINMGTSSITFPNRGHVVGTGNARHTRLNWDEGVGTAVTIDGSVVMNHMNLSGAFSSTSTDVGIGYTSGNGFSRFYDVKLDGWAKATHLDNHFNTVWVSCFFERCQGDATAFAEPGAVHVDVASGSNNNTRFIGCFFASNDIGPALVIEANEVQVLGYQGENNTAGEIRVAFGSGHQIIGVRVQNATGSPSIDVDDGSTTLAALDMEAGGSTQTAVDINGAGTSLAKVAGPFFFSGYGSNFAGVATNTSVQQKES